MTAEEAALRLGVNIRTWRAWESDRAEPRANRLMTMAGILGVAPLWLITGSGDGPETDPPSEGAFLRRELQQAGKELAALTRRIAQVSSKLEIAHDATR